MSGHTPVLRGGRIEYLSTREARDLAPLVVSHEEAIHRMIDERRELVAALELMLECPDINVDEMEPETYVAIAAARAASKKARGEC